MALSWCLPGEASERTETVLDRVASSGAFASSIWPAEAANVILSCERSGRLTEAQATAAMGLLVGLSIDIDSALTPDVFWMVAPLARRHGLTIYDASYLELSIRRGLPLATNDGALRKAAIDAGVEVL
jgi:predicted nucleic acid-binding protein